MQFICQAPECGQAWSEYMQGQLPTCPVCSRPAWGNNNVRETCSFWTWASDGAKGAQCGRKISTRVGETLALCDVHEREIVKLPVEVRKNLRVVQVE